jgi:hypothetical protein
MSGRLSRALAAGATLPPILLACCPRTAQSVALVIQVILSEALFDEAPQRWTESRACNPRARTGVLPEASDGDVDSGMP